MTAADPNSPGLQQERTQLAWERTAFSFLAVGALLAFRSHELLVAAHAVLAAIAVLAAASTYRIRRGQLLGSTGAVAPARWAIPATGIVTAALAIACGIAICL